MEATCEGRVRKLPKYHENVGYDSEYVYNYGYKVEDLDMISRAIQKGDELIHFQELAVKQSK